MIANERQSRITRQQLARLHESLDRLVRGRTEAQMQADAMVAAEVAALSSQIESLTAELADYDALRSGAVDISSEVRLSELPHLLIRARIARGLSQRDLAGRLGLKEQQVQRYESQGYATASLRRLQEVARAVGLRVAEEATSAGFRNHYGETTDIEWSRLPVKEMYRRGWFRDFSGGLQDALGAAEELGRGFVEQWMDSPLLVLNRQRVRAGSEYDRYALLAWQCRVLSVAAGRTVGPYRRAKLGPSWYQALLRRSLEDDGPLRAVEHLAEAGIVLVVESHLAGTYLDGAALLWRRNPVVAMTLRYDRLDHFWFVLVHELVHVMKHLRRGAVESVFDDLDAGVKDDIEREADEVAGEILVPASTWKTAVARYTRSSTAVRSLAQKLRISPAIIAGKIRFEARNYVILNDLVGQGEVRKHFPGAGFGQ